MACYLSNIDSIKRLEKYEYKGVLFETFVINEIVKNYCNNGLNPLIYLSWLRTSNSINNNEIDLLIIANNEIYPIEIKFTNIYDKHKFSSMFF